MYNRYSDCEELRPTGEASHIPDTRLDEDCEGDTQRQSVATSASGYLDAPTVTDGECRSCGASVPDSQTKCRFCLTNYLGSDATSTDEGASTRSRRSPGSAWNSGIWKARYSCAPAVVRVASRRTGRARSKSISSRRRQSDPNSLYCFAVNCN